MRVGILVSGLMGDKLKALFAGAGDEVVFSYARMRRARDRRDAFHQSGEEADWLEMASRSKGG